MFKIIQKCSNRFRRKKDHNVLLLMDNFSGQSLPDDKINKLTFEGGFCGFQYQNLLVLLLSPNFTSVCQPLDQGVISKFKAQYWRQHIAWVLQRFENNIDPKTIKVITHSFPIIFNSQSTKLTPIATIIVNLLQVIQ